ncbi:MAG: hypothetical protein H0W72_05135 [Planctomycetes bacterium]|nr:hypothetical protein [Planctomycetota bacterium]
MIDLEVSLDITPAVIRLERIAGRYSNFSPVLGGRVDVLARGLIRRMFLTQGRASGRGQWARLTERYLARRRFPAQPLLRQTDALYRTLTEKGAPGQRTVLTPNQYSLSVDPSADDTDGRPIIARFIGHQRGVPESNLPAREIIPDPLPQSFIQQVRNAVKAYVVTGRSR